MSIVNKGAVIGRLGRAVAVIAGLGLLAAAPASVPAAHAAARANVHRVRIASDHDAKIRNGPPRKGSGYVIGIAKTTRGHQPGVAFDVAKTESNGYRYGRFHGHFNACAWLDPKAGTTSAGTVSSARCPGGPAGRVLSARRFMWSHNGKLVRNCTPGKCKDGTKAAIKPELCRARFPGGVPAYGNVLPWRVPAVPSDRYATIKHAYRVYWRYVSRDGNWVMVHDHHAYGSSARRHAGFDAKAAKWFFVPRACMTGLHFR